MMKDYPNSLTKSVFTWFTLPPNSIHTWVQLEKNFYEKFFRGETKVSLVDSVSIKRQANKSIDDYLNRFRQMKAKCLTQVPEHEPGPQVNWSIRLKRN